MFKKVYFILKLIFAFSIMSWLAVRMDLSLNDFTNSRFVNGLIGAVLSTLAMIIINSFRWKILMNEAGFSISFGKCFSNNMIGAFFNSFIPSGFGGDVVRTIGLSRDSGIAGSVLSGGVIVDRLFGFLGLIIVFWLFYPAQPQPFLGSAFMLVTVLFVLGLMGLFVMLRTDHLMVKVGDKIKNRHLSRLFQWIQKMIVDLKSFAMPSSKWPWLILLSVIGNLFYILSYYVAIDERAVSSIGFMATGLAALGNQIALLLPATPGGIGYGQATLSFLFGLFGKDYVKTGVVAMTILQIAGFVVAGLGGIFIVLKRRSN